MRFKYLLSVFLISFLISTNLKAQEFTFAAMSDSRGKYNGVNEPVLSALVNHLVENQPEAKFLFFMGDMANGSKDNPEQTYNQLLHWKKVMAPVYNNPNMIWPYIWPTVGNHEIQHREDENNFRRVFQDVFMNGPDDEKGLTYSFDYNNVHFVSVTTDRWYYGDADDTTDDSRDWHYIKHLDWLESDLKEARNRNANYIFVFGHEMPFPIGGHLRDGLPFLGMDFKFPIDSTRQWYLDQRNKFWNLMKEYKVAAYICGHEHIYGRESVDGVYQIIAGSSGAPLYFFNSLYGDNPEQKKPGQELTYDEAIPYYKALNYNFGPGKNSQASEDFFGLRAFEYLIFDVKENEVNVKTYGAFPKEGTRDEIGTEISLIDEFTIPKP
jgi:predicted phosphodiesterase